MQMQKPQCFSHIGGQSFNIQIQGGSEVTIRSITASSKTCSATYWLFSLQKDIGLSLCTSVFSKGPDYSWNRNISTEINLERFWKLASYPSFLLKNPEFYETELRTFGQDLSGFCHPYLQGFCDELHFSIMTCIKISPFGFKPLGLNLPCAVSSAYNSLKHLLHFLMPRIVCLPVHFPLRFLLHSEPLQQSQISLLVIRMCSWALDLKPGEAKRVNIQL